MVWARHRKDDLLQCRALLAAGGWTQAHELLVSSVAPALLLSGHRGELAELLEQLVVDGGEGRRGIAATDWSAGGALYLNYLSFMQQGQAAAAGSEGTALLLQQLQAAGDRLASAGASSDPFTQKLQLRQQLVLSHMAHAVHSRAMGAAVVAGSAAAALRLGAMQGVLGLSCLPPELRMAGVAAAAASVTPVLV